MNIKSQVLNQLWLAILIKVVYGPGVVLSSFTTGIVHDGYWTPCMRDSQPSGQVHLSPPYAFIKQLSSMLHSWNFLAIPAETWNASPTDCELHQDTVLLCFLFALVGAPQAHREGQLGRHGYWSNLNRWENMFPFHWWESWRPERIIVLISIDSTRMSRDSDLKVIL